MPTITTRGNRKRGLRRRLIPSRVARWLFANLRSARCLGWPGFRHGSCRPWAAALGNQERCKWAGEWPEERAALPAADGT